MLPTPDTCFIPHPKTTFIDDNVGYLICQICQSSILGLHDASAKYSDSSPAILCCGHIFSAECLQLWLSYQQCCPVCRKTKYDGCSHPINYRVLFNDNIHRIPKTFPEADICLSCQLKAWEGQKYLQWRRELRHAKKRREKHTTDAEALETMKTAQQKLNQLSRMKHRIRVKVILED
ncbi:uncharacterized protein BCR38DRAFT_187798 [Pseudomassariella vexata]|uniref:RING-type domain-containing protein n=1 Tax=Pseudomassariella vexata TaxID=1141098 RepID=A0A1Y2E098_9PEZI|nr:uncharacterized protein BCR38DRAFT_187798 [Pseudomassariella vexata]ORY64952.1 hypothetical protein BCR38DRAFT_187798 [Pseudomassariella vexata]